MWPPTASDSVTAGLKLILLICSDTEAVGLFTSLSLSPLANRGFPLILLILSWATSMNQSSLGRTLQTLIEHISFSFKVTVRPCPHKQVYGTLQRNAA